MIEDFNPAATAEAIEQGIVESIRRLGRRGAVIAVSGGVDSGVTAALCARALGPKRIHLLRLPERNLSEGSSDLAVELAEQLGAPSSEHAISDALTGLGYYELEREAITEVFPDYAPDWKHKLVRSPPSGGMIVFSLVVEKPDGTQEQRRMPSEPYRKLLAATNMKQRTRKLIEYTWADRLHYAVAGTPNFVEYDQGFFVKGGDGLADLKPIAGLYKQQVFALARHLELPEGIAGRAPTTETFSLEQSQEEFYYGYPHDKIDVLLWGEQNGVPAAEVAPKVDLDAEQVEAAYWEIGRRREATEYLHAPAIVLGPDGRNN